MVKFINRITGTVMLVAEDRAEEYKAAGHKLAAKPAEKPAAKPEAKPTAKKSKK